MIRRQADIINQIQETVISIDMDGLCDELE